MTTKPLTFSFFNLMDEFYLEFLGRFHSAMIPATPATMAIRVTVRAITMTTSNENLYLPLFSTYIADIFWGGVPHKI